VATSWSAVATYDRLLTTGEVSEKFWRCLRLSG